ncbi:hypothetical protein [Azospirillum doebereinerae]
MARFDWNRLAAKACSSVGSPASGPDEASAFPENAAAIPSIACRFQAAIIV